MATDVNLILNCFSNQCRRNLDTSFGMKKKASLQWISSVGPLLNSVFLHVLNAASVTESSFSVEHVGWFPSQGPLVAYRKFRHCICCQCPGAVEQLQGGLCEERPELLHPCCTQSFPVSSNGPRNGHNWDCQKKWRMSENTAHAVRSELKKGEKHPWSHQGERRRKGRWCSRCWAEIPQ